MLLIMAQKPSSFSRSFHLPVNANEEDIHAKYEGGVLTLTIGRKISLQRTRKSQSKQCK
jgi:HSP20 family molecular chaperone IbpA